MKVLFLHPNSPDYLSESIFHGLRSLLAENCVDVPKMDCMYNDFEIYQNPKLNHNNGFTLYGLLEDSVSLKQKRFFWENELNQYNLIVISCVWKMDSVLNQLISLNLSHKLAILDGHDSNNNFPFINISWYLKTNPTIYFKLFHKIPYFKRELYNNKVINNTSDLLSNIFKPEKLFPISFSIPRSKIKKITANKKEKMFVNYIVDKEVAQANDKFFSQTGQHKHLFIDEKHYYDDLQKSWFGITTKRAGWDCLRHYEYAANGCILCFKDLDIKPEKCAPQGLSDQNCIIYKNYDDLKLKINNSDKTNLLSRTYNWINEHSTEKEAERFIKSLNL